MNRRSPHSSAGQPPPPVVLGLAGWVLILLCAAHIFGAVTVGPAFFAMVQTGAYSAVLMLCVAFAAVAFGLGALLFFLRMSASRHLFVAAALIGAGALFASRLPPPPFVYAQVAAAVAAVALSFIVFVNAPAQDLPREV